MSTAPNAQPRPSLRKPALSEPAKSSRLDQFGRDPESLTEKLRSLSDYEAEKGFVPFFDAMMSDMPRLLGESGISWALVLTILRLSLGRWHKPGEPRHEWTMPVSVEDLAEYCQCEKRHIQRLIAELSEGSADKLGRGVILKRAAMRGKLPLPGSYEFCLPLKSWRNLDDYAVWKQRCKQAEAREAAEQPEVDDPAADTTRDAVRLMSRPQLARPGKRLRAVKVKVEVSELVCQNTSPGASISFDSVVEPGGRMVISAMVTTPAALEIVPLPVRNAPIPPPKPTVKLHPRASEVAAVFDPILKQQGVPALSFDPTALNAAASELHKMPIDVLETFLTAPRGRDSRSSRASRPIRNGLACVAIVKECRLNWEARGASVEDVAERDGLLRELGHPAWESLIGMTGRKAAMVDLRATLGRSVNDPDFTTGQQEAARRLLEILK